jgi:hypothetical protein
MNKLKKSLAVAVILLFIGVAVAPSINVTVVKASTDNDLVEVTSEACGMKGFGNQTVKLTKQQYQNLEQYLVEFRARLNQTSTREEAVPIFKEAVVELNKYGLLPKGMSVQEAEHIIFKDETQYKNLNKFLRPFNKSNVSNLLCLISGNITNSIFVSGSVLRLEYLTILIGIQGAIFILKHSDFFYYHDLLFIITAAIAIFGSEILFPLFMYISYFNLLMANQNPVSIGHIIGVGAWDHYNYMNKTSKGWIYSIGGLGIKKWNGSDLIGTLPTLRIPHVWGNENFSYPGVIGFTGFKLSSTNDTKFFIGSALWVKIGSESPE